MSATTSGLHVEIDPALAKDAELAPLLEIATAYFENQHSRLPADPQWSQPVLVWRKSPRVMDGLRVEFREHHSKVGGFSNSVEIPTRRLFDNYARESGMGELMSDVRMLRSRVIAKEISRLIGEIEAEEAGG